MRKKDFTADFAEIKEMTNKIRMMNESINFSDDYADESAIPSDEAEIDIPDGTCADGECAADKMPVEDKSDEEKALETEGGADAVNRIREICLKGMISLCNETNNPVYITLKKIFNMVDKAVTEKNDENVEQ